MISSSALPIVVIFERHWDVEAKQIVKNLIPKLGEEGYDTFCFEAPQDLTQHEIVSLQDEALQTDMKINSQAYEYVERRGLKNVKLCDLGFQKLAELMRLCVSSQQYRQVAEKIKGLPASILLKDILVSAGRLSLSIKGVDIDAKDFGEMLSHDISQRMEIIDKNEDYRISTISKNLFSLYKQGKSLIFVCGALHAENLINQFKKQNINDNVLYYFPHSDKNYDDSVDDVKDHLSNKTLKNHIFRLLCNNDRRVLVEKIIKEIKSKNTHYKHEILEGNSHSQYLKKHFNKDFKVFMRPGHYVDALLDIEKVEEVEEFFKKFKKANIPIEKIVLSGTNHLVIRDINTKEVADNIRRLN